MTWCDLFGHKYGPATNVLHTAVMRLPGGTVRWPMTRDEQECIRCGKFHSTNEKDVGDAELFKDKNA